MALDISVSDPEKHGTSAVNAFIDFKIHTSTTNPGFASHDFFVRRRYRDFVWLRGQLCVTCPAGIVPPLPAVDSLVKDDRFSKAFIQRRQAGLELFLRRVAASKMLTNSPELRTFLEAKVWELQTVKNASSSSWFSSIFDGTDTSFKRIQLSFRQKVPDESEVERLRVFAREYEAVVSTAASKHHAFVRTLSDIAADLGQLGPALDMLSQSETELSLPFTHMASSLDRLKELHVHRVQAEHVSGLSALLAFNAGMASALKEVLSNRDASLIQYQRAAGSVESRAIERQRFLEAQEAAGPAVKRGGMLGTFDHLMHDPNRASKIDAKVAEAERELAAAKERWEAISGSIHTEAAAFHRNTNADFSRGLREHALSQIEFQEAQQLEWKELLEVFRRIETVPCGTSSSS
mmetsp:Transcript_48356/g.111958  ORF Transcript_48356/g.111958 Transcript_48356/m.111958 type:complete len:406 (-) Transcript_48356:715-1932(-)|eukprot:CAMPEP_0119356066 /NCGR_PEP_ID=MMETSP1334-20130426/4784_1 /TAXON_ID=127549 /ORGANISM="Calcidiscus leptoporus, Strain RCC1130" /LENGTH=405 /DNA_ID=CAMNT_0007370031 /DNA_START=72 /DNA_END=1289 /DNA_ORIENTATION=+